jgi:hypothetical protein
MMARSRRRLSCAATFLIRAFAPGCPTLLRSQESRATAAGEALTIFYDLPDDESFSLAVDKAERAHSLRLIRIGHAIVADLSAVVSHEHRTLKIEALLSSEQSEGGQA